jgi:hypothetical protein
VREKIWNLKTWKELQVREREKQVTFCSSRITSDRVSYRQADRVSDRERESEEPRSRRRCRSRHRNRGRSDGPGISEQPFSLVFCLYSL